ncbi:MAG: GNAT family N-acetyltransferase [Actinomycetota bacterium]|nr:GNAT family N-acetyltransferase [Actinomycetota bacterium]
MAVRRAVPGDAEAAAALILEPSPSLELIYGSRDAALGAAAAAFRSPRTILSHRFGLVAGDPGSVIGLLLAVPGELWPRLRVTTGLVMLRAAPHRGWRLLRRGRVLDRIQPAVPRDSLYVSSLAVGSGHRGRGVGGELMAAAVEVARWRKFGSVTLDVGIENEGARRFYERAGFVEVERRLMSERERRLLPAAGSIRMQLRL